MEKFSNSQSEEGDSEFISLQRINALLKAQLKLFFLPEKEKTKGVDKSAKSSKSQKDKSKKPRSQDTNLPPRNNKSFLSSVNWRHAAEIFFCGLVLTLMIPINVPLLFFNYFWRIGLSYYLQFRTKGRIRLMRGQDAFWASESPFNPGNFTSVYIIQGNCDLEAVRQKLSIRWVERKDKDGRPLFGKLKLKAVQIHNYFGWECHPSFDIREHVKYLTPEEPNKLVTETGLFDEISNIYDNILPDDKPQWEVLVVPNYVYENNTTESGRNGRHYALIFRVHHSFLDGLSAAQALRHVLADNVVEAGMDPMKPIKSSWWQRLLMYIFAVFLMGPYILGHVYRKKEENAFHGPGLCGPKTLQWSRPINVKPIKHLKEVTNSSVTAIFMSAIGGAFHTMTRTKGLPLKERITAANCAALLPYPDIKAQNRFCIIFSDIHATESDVLTRLRKAQEPFERKLESASEVFMAYCITTMGGCFPIPVMSLLQDKIAHGTVLISNLPGPLSTAHIMGGDPIIDMVGWSPIRNRIGVAVCLFGYNGKVRANVIADASVFPDKDDVNLFVTAFEQELLNLGNHFGVQEHDLFTIQKKGAESAGLHLNGKSDIYSQKNGFGAVLLRHNRQRVF